MTRNALFQELAELTAIDAPSGFEEPVISFIKEVMKDCCDEIRLDMRGNVYAVLEGGDSEAPAVMVVAHMDEVGLMVTSVSNGGFLRFTKIGGPTDMVLPGHRIRVLAGESVYEGMIGVKPGHVLSGPEARTVPAVEDMYIDCGFASEEDAEAAGIRPGTPAVFSGELRCLNSENLVYGKAVDDRAGILAMIHAAYRLKDAQLPQTVVWCFSVEEEIGLRGAAVAAMEIQPDVLIALDTCPAGGTPELSPDQLPWRIGKGPLIKVRETRGLSSHPKLYSLFTRTAELSEIPFQRVVDTAGITDASSGQQAGASIAALSIGLARRYSHSSVEVLDLDDLAALIDLLEAGVMACDNRTILYRG